METYKLMHRDTLCGVVTLDEDSGHLLEYKNLSQNAPFLGNADTRLMKMCLKYRLSCKKSRIEYDRHILDLPD